MDVERESQADSEEALRTPKGAEMEEPIASYPSHFRNHEAHPAWLRYGVPIYLIGTLGLLISANFGAGVRADYILREDDQVVEQRSLFTASIVSSVGELWNNESYPLAILIAITSVSWPYVELSLLFFSWMYPFRTYARRRERLLEILDMLGKWSFVDIIVLVEIIAAFRATIVIARGVFLEIVIVPEWGFYVFIIATMLSLTATDVILYHHRKVVYASDPDGSVGAVFSKKHKVIAAILEVCAFSIYLGGCFPDIFVVENTRGSVNFEDPFSIISVGTALSDAEFGGAGAGIRFIQVLWFFLCIVAPLASCVGFCILNTGLVTSFRWQRIVFMVSEAATAWSCAEVLVVSTVISILQVPTFGEGLVESDCAFCFSIDSRINSEYAVLCVGMVILVSTNFWLYRASHRRLYAKLK